MGMTQAVALIIAVALPLLVGALGSIVTFRAVGDWYPRLVQPSFAPPAWVFGPVWTMLYVMMGVASWLVWRHGTGQPEVRMALILYAVQLAFNLGWSWLFFGMHRPFLALLEIVVLLVLIGVTALHFAALSRTAALLMIPYLGWVGFATVLNGALWWLN